VKYKLVPFFFFVVVALVLIGCGWPYGDPRPYVGRWENPDYNGQVETAVVEFLDNDNGVVYANTFDTVGDAFTIDMDEEWYDDQENYLAHFIGYYATSTWHYLIRVSADGSTYQVMGTMAGTFAPSIDPTTTEYVYGTFSSM
jgi:hypothetical protein